MDSPEKKKSAPIKGVDPRIFSSALEIALQILGKTRWEMKIQDPDILQKYLDEYRKNLPKWLQNETKVNADAPFQVAISTLTQLLVDAEALKSKYVDPIPYKQEPLPLKFVEDMKKRIKNADIRGENVLVIEEPLDTSHKDDDLDWLIEEAGSKPDFWDTDCHENFTGENMCDTCDSPIVGIYAYTRKRRSYVSDDVFTINTCHNCYLKGSPNEFAKLCNSRYLIKQLEKELKCRLRRSQVPLNEKQIQGVDNLIPKELHDCFIKEMEKLVQISQNDFHPGTEGKIMNLIHPSMYPFLFDRSPCFLDKDPLIPNIKPIPKSTPTGKERVSLYQWLPAEVQVDADGCCEFTSYINNLYPDIYPNLYPVLGLILSCFLPLFEQCLDRSLKNNTLQVIVKASDYILKPGQSYYGNWHMEGTPQEHIVASGIYYYDVSEEIRDEGLSFRRQRDYEKDWPSNHDGYYEVISRTLVKSLFKFNLKEGNVKPEEIKHIVHGYWPDESLIEMLNATCDFSSLGFDDSVINLGHVETKPRRCVVFSNELQHKVEGVHLPETAQGTHKRRILCFFLVNPDLHLPSSKGIVPQQKRKIPDEVSQVLHKIRVNGRSLPLNICLRISGLVFPLFTLREALEHRLRFMHDRRIISHDENFTFEDEFSLCEH